MKKLIATLTAVIMLVATATAYAVPDIMTTYMLQTINRTDSIDFDMEKDDDSRLDVRMQDSIYWDVEKKVIDAPIQWWEDDWFGDPVHDKAQALTSADVDSMVLTEVVSLRVTGYAGTEGVEIPVRYHFTDDYPTDFEFVAIVGSESEDAETQENVKKIQDWQALRAEPVDRGVDVFFTHDALTMINGKDAILVLLCITGNGAERKAMYKEDEGDPSKTVGDMTRVELVQAEGEDRDFILDINPLNELGRKIYRLAIDYVTVEGNIIDFFGPQVREAAQKLLPDVDLDTLEIYEADDWIAYGYDYRHGEVLANVTFPENFRDGQKIVVIVGAYDDNSEPVWTAQEAEISGGSVLIHFTENAVTRAELKTNILFVLGEPIE